MSLCLCGFITPLNSQITPHFPQRQFDAISFRDAFWLGTSSGLYQYRSAENVWSVRSIQNGLLSNTITKVASDDDALWIGQSNGVTIYNLQTNTMLSYDSTRGLPTGKILSIAFDKDYVWIGTEQGAARYDRLIEEWQGLTTAQGLSGESVFSISPRSNVVYMISNTSVNEYDPRYERWRKYDGGENDLRVRDAFTTTNNAWLLRDSSMLRFDFNAKTFQKYELNEIGNFDDILEIIIEGETFWILTRDGFWYYDPNADAFRPFLELVNLPDKELRGVAFSSDAKSIWFSTRTGVSRFDRPGKSWQYFNEAGGMPTTDFNALFMYGNELLGIAHNQIAYFKTQENRWYSYPLLSVGSSLSTTKISIDPAQGTYADFGDGYKLSLSGTRTSWLFKTTADSLQSFGHQIETSSRNDLKARFDFPGGRSLNATYNDADFSDVMYGAQFRGAPNDIVQSIQLGDLRVEQGAKSLLQSFGIFGGGARFTVGDKTEKYHRSFFELAASVGHKTTAITSDFFYGRSRRTNIQFRDVDFQRRTFYRLDKLQRDIAIDPATVTVFMTRSQSSVATKNILTDTVIAGIRGQWIRLQEVKDYIVDAGRGILQLTQPLQSKLALAASFNTIDGQRNLILLSSPDSSTQEMKNIYSLRAGSIYPRSLSITITDKYGGSFPLSSLALDQDHDGAVDAEFVDYRNGMLRFPFAQPFPPDVYRDSAVSYFKINTTFETSNSSFELSQKYLVRGSEKIIVDGAEARAGYDYVLDYTSGYLSFTRDGVINDDSKIEITYEYVRNRAEEKYFQATAALSPSDNFQTAITASRFKPMNGNNEVTLVHGLTEIRLQSNHFDLRIVPEYSRTNVEKQSGDAYNLFTTFSAGDVRLSIQTRHQNEKYVEPFVRLFPFGKLRDETIIHGEYDLMKTLRLFADWKKRDGRDTIRSATSSDEFGTVGVQWFEPGLPSITIRGENILNKLQDSTHHRQVFRADLDYVPTSSVLQTLGLSSAVFSSYLRYAQGKQLSADGYQRSQEYTNIFLRTVISPRPLFTINSYYRGDVQNRLRTNVEFKPYLSTEKFFADVIMENIRGLSLALRYTRDLKTLYSDTTRNLYDGDSKYSFQISSRFSPGVVIDFMNPFTFEINFRDDASTYLKNGSDARPLFISLFKNSNAQTMMETGSRLYEGKIEWRPTSEISYYATARLSEGSVSLQSSQSKDQRRDLTQRVDYRPGSRELYSARFTILDSRQFNSNFTRYAPSVWLENRWSGILLTRLILDAQFDSQWFGNDNSATTAFTPGGNITLTFTDVKPLQRIEIRDDISLRNTTITIDPIPYPTSHSRFTSTLFINTLYFDLYPHPTSYLRFQVTQQWNLPSQNSQAWTQTDASLQVTVQL